MGDSGNENTRCACTSALAYRGDDGGTFTPFWSSLRCPRRNEDSDDQLAQLFLGTERVMIDNATYPADP